MPAYFSNLDPLSALISFNIESGDPTRTTTPDEMYVVCWPNGYRPSNEDGQDESIPVEVVNGNMYITLFDSSCVYEVVATWNGDDGRSDTLRYTFGTYKNSMNFSLSAAAVIEILALGNGGFCQITDDDVIATIVDKINYAKF